MTISIKPTASGSTIEQDGSTILTVDGSGNITPSNDLYPKVPAFRANKNLDQNISAGTWTKVIFDTEDFDTNSDYDNSTNYRFTPTVAGYYQITGSARIQYSGAAGDYVWVRIYKNGSAVMGMQNRDADGQPYGSIMATDLIYFNGSSDYVEIYVATGHSSAYVSNSFESAFHGHLVSV